MYKIKQFIMVGLLVGSGLLALASASPVSALTDAERSTCKDRWSGKVLDTQAEKDSFNNSKCAKQNYCSATSTKEVGETGKPVIVQRIQCGADRNAGPGGTTSDGSAPSCGELQTSLISCKADSDYPVVNLVLDIVNFLAVGVGIAVVGGIIWGGMLYASSNGDSTKAKQGVTTIVNSVIGLLLFIFTFALVNFLVPGGLFN